VAQNIGFIGVGPINSTLARFAVAAGMDVILSNSRGPETLTEKRAEFGHHARAATVEEAAQVSDIVVISIPTYTTNFHPRRSLGRLSSTP
jgi:8-hydroxy-5-deazaflavin:NADPH oxidoreductase